ncbi:hypothetical protein BGZ83_001299 [Gryganskiella cystojenkinii]|nr:hypothetical protein BGZ83_001299 [Gryganskiella cystojenkinii]
MITTDTTDADDAAAAAAAAVATVAIKPPQESNFQSLSTPPSPKQSIPNELLEEEVDNFDIGAAPFGDDAEESGLTEQSRLRALSLLPWYRRPSIRWLIPFAAMLALIIGISSAPQDQMVIKIICKDYLRKQGEGGPIFDLQEKCNTPEIQATAAIVTSHLRSVKYICSIFTIGFFSAKSDIWGRKYLIYLSVFPFISTQLLIIFLSHPERNLGLGLLYADSLLTGCLGGGTLLEPSVNAYVADITPRDKRSVAMGYLMVALSVGITFGPLIGGYLTLLTGEDASALKLSVVGLSIVILYTMFLPESHLIRTSSKALKLSQRSAENGDSSSGGGLVLIFRKVKRFVIGNLVYGWRSIEDGIYLMVYGVSTFIVYIALFPLMQSGYRILVSLKKQQSGRSGLNGEEAMAPLLESAAAEEAGAGDKKDKKDQGSVWKDLSFFFLGSVVYSIGFAIVPAVHKDWILYIACAVHALASVGMPSFTSLLTTYVPAHQTGKALGGIAVLDSILSSTALLLYGWIFSVTSSTMPSAAYVVSTCICLCSIVVLSVIWSTYRRADRAHDLDPRITCT